MQGLTQYLLGLAIAKRDIERTDLIKLCLFCFLCFLFMYISFFICFIPQKAQSQEYQKESTAGKGFNSCDAYAVAAAIDSTVITEHDEVHIFFFFFFFLLKKLQQCLSTRSFYNCFGASPTPTGHGHSGAGGEVHTRHDGAGLHGVAQQGTQGVHHEESGLGEVQADDDEIASVRRACGFR